jgi:transcriptional regulator with XRE-family HTH domain
MGALKEIVGANVRRLRLESGRTQEDVAYAAQISVRHLSAIEHGRENLTLKVLEDLAATLGVRPSALLDDEAQLKAAAGLRHQGDGEL